MLRSAKTETVDRPMSRTRATLQALFAFLCSFLWYGFLSGFVALLALVFAASSRQPGDGPIIFTMAGIVGAIAGIWAGISSVLDGAYTGFGVCANGPRPRVYRRKNTYEQLVALPDRGRRDTVQIMEPTGIIRDVDIHYLRPNTRLVSGRMEPCKRQLSARQQRIMDADDPFEEADRILAERRKATQH